MQKEILCTFPLLFQNLVLTISQLDDIDIIDLCWIEGPIIMYRPSHLYLLREAERRAWEKYGGPQGLKAQRKL